MPSSTEWLNNRGCEYLAAIHDLQPTFLGELPVAEKDLPELFFQVRKAFDPGLSDAVRACTALAAVHAAVHASEDHSSYIGLFFERLGVPIDVVTWNQTYGPAILQFLIDHFDEVDRPGGFRYVRPILNQAGISYRAMPAFARFLGKLLQTSGMSFTRSEYEKCLRSVTSNFARRFLIEGPGFDFTRDAARTLERIQSGLTPRDAIDTIPGYRSGFWTELLEHLEAPTGQAFRSANYFAAPAEYLDSENERLVVRFDEQGIARRAYLLNGRPVNFAVQPVTDRNVLSGIVRQPNGSYQHWMCEPWLPGKSDWALFRATDGRFVCDQQAAPQDGSDFIAVQSGQYLLVATDELLVPEGIVVAQGAYLEAPDHSCSLYRIWAIELEPGTEISTFAMRVTGAAVPSLSFAGERDALRATGSRIFAGKMSKIIVGGWTDAAAKNYTILIDVGSGPTCLDGMIVEGTIQPNLPTPCQGRVWIEPRGRTRYGSASLPNLDFAVLRTTIAWQIPHQPFDISEEVPVALETVQLSKVDWKSPVVQLFPQHWKIKAGVRVAEGTLICEGVHVQFSLRVPRTAVFALGTDPDFSILWTESDDKGPSLRAEALPGERASLQLKDETAVWTLWDLGRMPSSGVVECNRNTFRDYLQEAKFAAARVGIQSRGRTNWSTIWIASARAIQLKIASAQSDWAGWALPTIGALLRKLRCLEEASVEQIDVDSRVFQTPLASFIADALVCAQAIEHTTVICSTKPKIHASAPLISLLECISTQREACGKEAATKQPDFDLIPIRRLCSVVKDLWEQRTWNDRLPELVAEWRSEVTSPIGSPHSRITKLPGGTELTDTARKYAQVVPDGSAAQFNALIGLLSRPPDENVHEVCHALKLALNGLALYHSGRYADVAEMRTGGFPTALRRLQAQMEDLACLCRQSKPDNEWPDGIGFSDISPAQVDADLEHYLSHLHESTGTGQCQNLTS